MNPTQQPTHQPTQATKEEVEAAQEREAAIAQQASLGFMHQRIMQLSIELDRMTAERDQLRAALTELTPAGPQGEAQPAT